ncbi:MAG TPA: TadE family protein, partial [Candidatus Limnocylindrales bacterium]
MQGSILDNAQTLKGALPTERGCIGHERPGVSYMAFRGEASSATALSRLAKIRIALGGRRGRLAIPRGQSLVEFALILPAMLFLSLIVLDFGRVYLGWI